MSDPVTVDVNLRVAYKMGMVNRKHFTEVRLARGWTFTGAANRIRGVTEQQLRNIEGVGATRDTDPGHIRLETALAIIEAYWPDLDFSDFVERTDLSAKPSNATARRRLKKYA